MSRVYNFSAGPAVLPEEVLKEAQEEMLDYRGCGMSVMEMSHRSKVFQNIIDEAEADLRDLMGIPSNYKVLFLFSAPDYSALRAPVICKIFVLRSFFSEKWLLTHILRVPSSKIFL